MIWKPQQFNVKKMKFFNSNLKIEKKMQEMDHCEINCPRMLFSIVVNYLIQRAMQ